MLDQASVLVRVQNILLEDEQIASLMNLTGKTKAEKAEKIITKSTWHDLVQGEKKLCVFFIPSRQTANDIVREEVLQFECHFPNQNNIDAYRTLKRIFEIFHKKQICSGILRYYNQMGELPTSEGFFCCGSRFNYYNVI